MQVGAAWPARPPTGHPAPGWVGAPRRGHPLRGPAARAPAQAAAARAAGSTAPRRLACAPVSSVCPCAIRLQARWQPRGESVNEGRRRGEPRSARRTPSARSASISTGSECVIRPAASVALDAGQASSARSAPPSPSSHGPGVPRRLRRALQRRRPQTPRLVLRTGVLIVRAPDDFRPTLADRHAAGRAAGRMPPDDPCESGVDDCGRRPGRHRCRPCASSRATRPARRTRRPRAGRRTGMQSTAGPTAEVGRARSRCCPVCIGVRSGPSRHSSRWCAGR